MTTLILLSMLILSVTPLITFADNLPTQIRVIFNQTRIYSTNKLSGLETLEDVQSITIRMAYLHEVFIVVDEIDDLYEIQLEEQNGYILKISVIDNSLSSPEAILQTNAKTTTEVFAYEKIGETYFKHEEITLQKDTRIRILDGYDKGKQYTLVSFEKENITYTYYVKTALIDPDGIDRTIILAITLILACVSGGLVLFKIFKPKRKIIN